MVGPGGGTRWLARCRGEVVPSLVVLLGDTDLACMEGERPAIATTDRMGTGIGNAVRVNATRTSWLRWSGGSGQGGGKVVGVLHGEVGNRALVHGTRG